MTKKENENTHPDTGEQQLLPFDPPLEETAGPETNEIDALRAENEQLKTSIRLRDAREQIAAALSAAGARSPGLLFEAAKDGLQFGENGELVNAAAIVEEMKRKFPEQFGVATEPPVDGGAGTADPPNTLSKSMLARMSPAEIARLDWAAVKQALSQ